MQTNNHVRSIQLLIVNWRYKGKQRERNSTPAVNLATQETTMKNHMFKASLCIILLPLLLLYKQVCVLHAV